MNFVILLALFSTTLATQNENGCLVSIPLNYSHYPLVFDNNELLLSWKAAEEFYWDVEDSDDTYEAKLFVESGYKIQLKCSGRNNGFVDSQEDTNIIEAECIGGLIFKTTTGIRTLEDLKCREVSTFAIKESQIMDLKNECQLSFEDEVGSYYEVVRNDAGKEWFYDICYNHENGRTIWTRHSIKVTTERKRVYLLGSRPPFYAPNVHGIYSNVDVIGSYGPDNAHVNSAIKKWTGSDYGPKFDKGHLVPQGDFSDAVARESTFFFFNVQAQHRTINQGNWAKVEKSVRDNRQNVTDDIYTATHGTLKRSGLAMGFGCPSQNPFATHPAETPCWDRLNRELLPIPSLYFKQVSLKASDVIKVHIIITSNDPIMHITLPPQYASICSPDVCLLPFYAWLDSTLRNIATLTDKLFGYTYCCPPFDPYTEKSTLSIVQL